ncbi:hypothetical protein P3X46_014146 [Hevea brasiliensis]|uniref:RING-Gid-type domain-containing protein n=1 Tax=Hevea brasiliensis TaxID=3981 RepID=A0ABQ9M7U2_HEVBR|nr:hypothetical protein P3X46_014146 [Hevea brasiliensis]
MDSLPNGSFAVSASAATNPINPTHRTPSSKLTQLTESLKPEHQFLRVPFEHYKKTIRINHRVVEKEVSSVISGVTDAANSDMSKDDAVQHLTSLVSRLQGLKRKDLVDIAVFQEARRVIDALQNREAAPALAWRADNKSRLKMSKGATYMKELKQVIATLAFKSHTDCATYKLDYLVDQFKQEFCRLYGMTLEPLLNIYLKAGLFALKTLKLWKLALPLLPYSKQHYSKLVCYITKELMDTENPPQVLPNGYVYSTKALGEMAKKNNGKITCPRTGLICSYSEVVKAYIS